MNIDQINNSEVLTLIEKIINENEVVLFLKGDKNFQYCGFSSTVVGILKNLNIKFKAVDVLADEKIRQGIKDFSDWPTIPQLYVRGEFIGGCDIIREIFEDGSLKKFFEDMNS